MKFEQPTPKNDHPDISLSEQISIAYQTQNISQADHLRLIALLGDADAFKRSLFTPGHFTASAFVFSPERDAVLLIQHSFLKLWLQPGGHIEEIDGSIIDAMLREIEEETGVISLELLRDDNGLPRVDFDIHPIPENPKKNEPEHHHFDIRCGFIARTTEVQETGEVDAVRFVPISELEALDTDDSVRSAVRFFLS